MAEFDCSFKAYQIKGKRKTVRYTLCTLFDTAEFDCINFCLSGRACTFGDPITKVCDKHWPKAKAWCCDPLATL